MKFFLKILEMLLGLLLKKKNIAKDIGNIPQDNYPMF
jgi:hypothetical protein